MRTVLTRLQRASRTRTLLGLTLCLGLMTSSVGDATSAAGGYELVTDPSVFQSGTVDIAGLLAGSTASTLPNSTAFSWTTGGAGTDCASVFTLVDTTSQAMAPGHFCIAKVTIRNTNSKSVDAWFRMRLVRATASGGSQVEALNNRLRFFMHEYTAGSARTALQYQTADCTVTNYRPVPPLAGTARSTATIATVTSATNGNRTALLVVGPEGKNLGKHPGISSPADSGVAALANTGFGLRAGTASAAAPTESATFTSSNMSTDPSNSATYNAFNLVGNDEVTNTRRLLESNTPNGTRPGGNLLDGELLAGQTRYYCAALYFPSDSDVTAANGSGDNSASGASLTYYVAVAAGQQFGRSVN